MNIKATRNINHQEKLKENYYVCTVIVLIFIKGINLL